MADHRLIEEYLAEFGSLMRWHRDPDGLIEELRDHLLTATSRLVALGLDEVEAQEGTLCRFGDPKTVAMKFAESPSGGLAIPTSSTKGAGKLAEVAAWMWVITVTAWWVAGLLEPVGGLDRNASAVFWSIGWVALIAAVSLGVVIASALIARHGGLGALGAIGLGLVAVASMATVFAWVFLGWGLALLLGSSLIGYATLGRSIAPRLPILAFSGGATVGGLLWLVLTGIWGSPSYTGLWGDGWIVNLAAVSVAGLIVSAGLHGIGAWLSGEEPAWFDGPEPSLGNAGGAHV